MTATVPRAVVRLRTLVPKGISPVQSDVIDQLQEFKTEGIIADLDIDTWGSSMGMSISNDRDPTETQKLLSEFEQWEETHNCTLGPAFGRSDTKSSDDGNTENGTYTTLPLLCLVIYNDTTTQAIYPHRTSEEVHTVHDGLAALEAKKPAGEQIEVASSEKPTATGTYSH
ncbi:HTH domain-containing protein [Halalkalicoccus subterraneus]|uniref:HTH domain-containing protein n=1 Tax=Halalkalicoccus subterraneus TaxID=2675002 RepID=UPI000EFC2CD9|nr:HTH domain-containing protein [Halalkalicoccus subterraneus]